MPNINDMLAIQAGLTPSIADKDALEKAMSAASLSSPDDDKHMTSAICSGSSLQQAGEGSQCKLKSPSIASSTTHTMWRRRRPPSRMTTATTRRTR